LLTLGQGWQNLWVITASHLVQGVREQLPELPESNLLVEPVGRDTAPAVAWATLAAAERYGESAMLGFFPADHWIDDRPRFEATLKAASELASQEGTIVTLGIQPTYAATGYGYIEQGTEVGQFDGLSAYRVNRFTEKPDLATAQTFVDSGRFSWNGGIFIFPAGVALGELRAHAPEMMNAIANQGSGAYGQLNKISIDYALMEKTQRICVLPVKFGWDDLGDWNGIERLLKRKGTPNVELANHVGLASEGCIFYGSDPDEVMVSIGLEDIVVVREGKATLVVHKDRTQDIKKVLKELQANPRYQHLL
jgi:mannose-1-phosphate guanylyltransferase